MKPAQNEEIQSTFLFHDYETFGTSPSLDRPAQFAAIRTDADFNIIGEPEVFYCKPADDYLPQPEAVLITGITPQHAKSERR
jgi:exodeoxyribonuclease-1